MYGQRLPRPGARGYWKHLKPYYSAVKNCFSLNGSVFILFELEMCISAARNSDFALVDDAVVIDLSYLNTVTVDVQSKVCMQLYFA